MHFHASADRSVRQFIELHCWDRSVDISFETHWARAFYHCHDWSMTALVNLHALYWATQSKRHQLAFRADDYDRSEPDGNPEQKLLCVKRGHWIPAQHLHLHLPLAELEHFRARTQMHDIRDSALTCWQANRQSESPEEDSHY